MRHEQQTAGHHHYHQGGNHIKTPLGLLRHRHQIRDSACNPYNLPGNYGLVWTNRDDSRAWPGVALGPAK
jgi:hypothetical protein